MNKKNVIAIIPARYASTRFPGKPLADINGKSMIRRVYEQVSKSVADKVIVATDSKEIFDHVKYFGGEAMMTSKTHNNGTERCAEVVKTLMNEMIIGRRDIVINVQGDEPFIRPEQINYIANTFLLRKIKIVTLAKLIEREEEFNDPNVVKVIFDKKRCALYFSRASIPYMRNENVAEKFSLWKHIGIYGYRVKTLLKLAKMASSPLEQMEMLEQLRWLENGQKIYVTPTNFNNFAIDTPEDIKNIPFELFENE
ncbi:MAG: 3-deoxy-manno-octulosonate cytidylyltransferase [Bacteroidales bacterium]|nr:3-deoxy-manno-octulosonate cytidylyltransferase [Bacteroidales bacterium]